MSSKLKQILSQKDQVKVLLMHFLTKS